MFSEAVYEEKRLASDEGFECKMYRDSRGVTTIGYGTNLDVGLTELEARLLLRERMNVARKDAARVCQHFNIDYEQLPMDVRGALLNFLYNVGFYGAKGFVKMFSALAARDFIRASYELLQSRYADQVGDRAIRLANRIACGSPQLNAEGVTTHAPLIG